MATLHNRLIDTVRFCLAQLLLVQSLYFLLPLFLYNLYHIALVFRLENGQLHSDRAFFNHCLSLELFIKLTGVLQPLYIISNNLGRHSVFV